MSHMKKKMSHNAERCKLRVIIYKDKSRDTCTHNEPQWKKEHQQAQPTS